MDTRFSKPQPARELEARSRARLLGVRVAVVVPQQHYVTTSQSEPGLVYRLDKTRRGWTCECLGYRHTGCCKHLGQLARRADREGWTFGQVAPSSELDREPLDLIQERARRARADLYGD